MSKAPPRKKPDARHDPKQLEKLFTAIPPHAVEAEMAVIGSVLIEPDCIGDVLQIMSSDDFHAPKHALIFDAMTFLYDRNSHVDIVDLHQRLIDRGSVESIGGLEYLVQLANAVPSAASAKHYATLVRDKARVRAAIKAAGDLLYDAHNRPDEIDAIVEEAEAALFKMAKQDGTGGDCASLRAAIEHAILRTEKIVDSGGMTGLRTGYSEIDDLTGGLQPGELIVIGARPSMGKSALASCMAEHMALAGHRVGVFSLEMSREMWVQRMLASASQVDATKIRRGQLTAADFERLMAASGSLMDAPMFIDDTPGITNTQMRSRARRMKQREHIECLFIDYLQLMRGPNAKRENRQVEVSDISQTCKSVARELNIPVVVLAQLNRGNEATMRRPRMSDLRESGSIEQDADVVMLLHREEYYHRSDPDWAHAHADEVGVAELDIAKQRNGPVGLCRLTWHAETTRFRDWTHNRYGAPSPSRADLGLPI